METFSASPHILWGHNRLELQIVKMSVSLASPYRPKSILQRLLTTLRITTRRPIPSCSEASGVFPSWCGKSASLPTLHFHRAIGWDSPPVVPLFMRVGTYPTRYFATFRQFILFITHPPLSGAMRASWSPMRSDYIFPFSMHYFEWVQRLVSEDSLLTQVACWLSASIKDFYYF